MVADHVLCPRCRHANAPENRFCGSCGASFEASGELVGYIRWETMREHVMREVANRAATDPEFLGQARRDLEGALIRYGYHLTDEELQLVKNLQRQTAEMSDKELARTLAVGVEGRTGSPPARPAGPSWRGTGPARPARPENRW